MSLTRFRHLSGASLVECSLIISFLLSLVKSFFRFFSKKNRLYLKTLILSYVFICLFLMIIFLFCHILFITSIHIFYYSLIFILNYAALIRWCSYKVSKKINGKNVDIKAEKEVKREKNKKRTRKSFTKGREDGNINGHSTRESSERTLKTEQERIKHNVN